MTESNSRGTAKKTVVFLSILFCIALGAACVIGAYGFYQQDYYTTPKDVVLEDIDYEYMQNDGYIILNSLLNPESYGSSSRYSPSVRYAAKKTNLCYILTSPDGTILSSNITDKSADSGSMTVIPFFVREVPLLGYSIVNQTGNPERYMRYEFQCRVLPGTPFEDNYRLAHLGIGLAYAARYAVFPVGIAAAAAVVVLYVLLLSLAGRRPDSDRIWPGPLYRVPFDVLLTGGVLAGVLLFGFPSRGGILSWIHAAVFLVYCLIAFLGLSMSAAVRIKMGTIFSGLFVWKLLVTLWRIAKWLLRGLKNIGSALVRFFRVLPSVWMVVLLFAAVAISEVAVYGASYPDDEVYWIFHIIEWILLFALCVWAVLCLRRLKNGAEAIASGDFGYQTDTRRLAGDFKRIGDALGQIGGGLNRAVEERMKSERMKTELITNVSHDIKTPLTSVINYADLISKEPCDNETVREYAGVLLRQSERLKRLIDDLVEASKASTGNLDVVLAPCDVSVFLEQASGEYDQRLSDAGMKLLTAHPDHPVTILADGRRLWRVFDNLMNNIVKYGQPGTRVYLTLEEINRFAVVTFRNVSREPLNVSPDELMERFVRGDASRNGTTEGNGLGLSIAKSLTELQGGALTLSIDGDLFKAVLHFPVSPTPTETPLPMPAPAPERSSGLLYPQIPEDTARFRRPQ